MKIIKKEAGGRLLEMKWIKANKLKKNTMNVKQSRIENKRGLYSNYH